MEPKLRGAKDVKPNVTTIYITATLYSNSSLHSSALPSLLVQGVKPWAIFVPALAQFPPFIFFATQIRQVINPPIEVDPLNKITDGMISKPNLEAAEGLDEAVQDLSRELANGGCYYIRYGIGRQTGGSA